VAGHPPVGNLGVVRHRIRQTCPRAPGSI